MPEPDLLPDNHSPAPVGNVNPAKPGNGEKDLSHTFVGAATIGLTAGRAYRAHKYGSIRADDQERIEILDVYCSGCRRHIDDLTRGSECAAKVNNTHLIGGDQRVRAKRKPRPDLPAGATRLPPPRINRLGLAAYLNGNV